jgi:hypothetical protein
MSKSELMKIEQEIEKIKERNARVEIDKAWETSKTRRVIIAGFIYIFASIIFVSIKIPDPFLNALIPTCAFVISMASFPFFKEFWMKNFYKRG